MQPGDIVTCSNLEYAYRRDLQDGEGWHHYQYIHFNDAFISEAPRVSRYMFRVPLEDCVVFDRLRAFMEEHAEGSLTMHYDDGLNYGFSNENDALVFKLTYL
jgi:hypothetical protein